MAISDENKAKLDALYKAQGEAVAKHDSAAVGKLQAEIKKLEGAEKDAEQEAQKGIREAVVKAAQAALKGIKLPSGLTLSVTGKLTDTGFDDWTASVGLNGLLDMVHEAMGDIDIPSTVKGFTFTDGVVNLTGGGRGTGTGSGGGGKNFWAVEGGENLKLAAAFDLVATDEDRAEVASKDKGGEQWTVKVRVVKAKGYEAIKVA